MRRSRRRSARRAGPSCGRDRCAAGGPATPGWAARPRPSRGQRRAAAPAAVPSPSLPSIAQRRAGHAEAQRSSVRVIAGEATTWSSPSCCRCSSTATAVWVRLCGSMPMVTNVASCASCMLDTASNLNSGMTRPLSSYAVCGHGRRAGYARATPSSVGKKQGACRPCPAVTQPRIVARRAVDIQTSQKHGPTSRGQDGGTTRIGTDNDHRAADGRRDR